MGEERGPMSFLYANYFPIIFIVALLFSFLILKYEKSYFEWIKKYWFFTPSKGRTLKHFFYFSAVALLLLSLLDLRGREETMESKIPDQKTVVMIDNSASMLVEDVRPNRLKKSLLMARHFIKKAFGHRISLVLFSDTQRQIVPFTDDIDLLDARVAAIEKKPWREGGLFNHFGHYGKSPIL